MSQVRLLVLSEPRRGESFPLGEENVTIGRTERCDICIPDSTISSHHCTVIYNAEDNSYSLRDEDSTNGTRINEQRVEGVPVKMKSGDILQLGGVEVLFENQDGKNGQAHSAVIDLTSVATGEFPTRELKNLGERTGVRRSKDLRGNKKQTMIITVIVAVIALMAIGVGVLALLGAF